MSRNYRSQEPSSREGNWLGRAIVVLVVWGAIGLVGYVAISWLFSGPKEAAKNEPEKPAPISGPGTPAPKAGTVNLGVAYGSEKTRWLEAAVADFANTPEGATIRVNLQPAGSLKTARKIVDGDKQIQVWSPASSVYRDTFLQEWEVRRSGNPIAKEEILALSPMVFVMWRDRYDAFIAKYKELNFQTVSQAIQTEGGWGGIAKQPDWGLFKFGHTHPNESNSGLLSLVLMAYDFHGKNKGLTPADIVDPKFQGWLGQFERGVSGQVTSTADLMREMVLKGPSSYDAVMVYEAVAIDFLKNAEGRWGEVRIVYPARNIWNDNPYYVLKTEWTTPEQQQAAEAFVKFLMSEPIQQRSLEHGFRPGNPAVAVKFPESPFVRYQKYGLKIDLPEVCQTPTAEVINNLLQSWQRAAGAR
jgi:ABC-type sulfate transport system substrate-binding protein